MVNLDSANAYILAKKYSADAKGDLEDAISGIVMMHGSEEDYDVIFKNYSDMPPGQSKLTATPQFCVYLSKLNDAQKINNGIDKVIAFRNAIPQAYRGFTDPVINGGLQQIATAKGGDVQAYIQTQMK